MTYRPFLKWPGGKYRLVDKIVAKLPKAPQLVEPFLGSGSVFLNTDYEHYALSDCNADLIDLYNHIKHEGQAFIDYVRQYFSHDHNTAERFYDLRAQFNETASGIERAALFLYLNRHGFNGLCRYNQSGHFNVPFGQYKQPYFPEKELKQFHEKAQRATFTCQDFSHSLQGLKPGCAVYADPPYVPLTKTASFTQYAAGGFAAKEQEHLAALARSLAKSGVGVLLSNHDTPYTRAVYEGAHITSFKVRRTISARQQGRHYVQELLALFKPTTLSKRRSRSICGTEHGS